MIMMCPVDTCSSCCCCLHRHSIFSTKTYLGRIGLRPVFSSKFFPQWPLRMELTWFWPVLKEETSPKSNSKNVSWYHFTNMGIRVPLKTFPPQQLRVVSHVKLLSMINCSNGDFRVSRRSSKNWEKNRLPWLLGRRWPHFASPTDLTDLTSDVRQGLEYSAISFGRERKVLNMCSQSSMNSYFTAAFLILSCTFRR